MTRSQPRGLASAVISTQIIGYLGAGVMPVIVGALIDGPGLDEVQAGIIGSIELGAIALASFALSPRVGRISLRVLAVAGLGIALAGYAASAWAETFGLLMASRIACGVGEGCLIAAGAAAAARSKRPDQLFASAILFEGLAIAVVLGLLPLVLEPWGHRGGYLTLLGACVLFAPLLRWLPPKPAEARTAVRERAPHRWLASLGLAAMLLLAIGQGALWPFTERVGIEAGLTRWAAGAWLGASTLAGLVGAAFAAWLNTRIGRPIPLTVGMLVTGVSAWCLLFAGTPSLYVAMLLVWSIAYFFTIPYLLGTAAALDRQGRWTAAANGVSAVASALGPAFAGLLVTATGYGALGWVIAATGLAGTALILPVSIAVERVERDRRG